MVFKNISKTRMNFFNIIVGFTILTIFGLIVKNMFYQYAIETNVDKARVVTQELLATRHYLAQIAPYASITDKNINTFAVSPAFVGSKVGESLKEQGFIYIKQTAIRYRNKNNAPDNFEADLLQKYEQKKINGEHYEISMFNEQEHLRYAYPLYIEKSCLACHGKPYVEVKENIYKELVKNYGERSFNYKEGDLRGIISVAINMQDIDKTLESLNLKMLLMMALLFVVILLFFYMEKKFIYDPQIKEIQRFNETLESKIAEEVAKNREQDKQLIQQSRLAQMGEMISMIAHQWRQPLSAISATSSSLELKATLNKADSETVIQLSQKISGYAQHLSSTINDFRSFFKENKTQTTTNLKIIVEATLSIVEISLESKNIKLIKNFHCNKDFVTYENEVKQVVLNIIKNAEDILVENKVENPFISIEDSCGIDGETPTLLIKDNGGGIPANIMDKIFNPYFSTKTKKDGTGLGLYMSKTIIEEHCHGKLSVYNEGDGAVFRIEFMSQGKNDE